MNAVQMLGNMAAAIEETDGLIGEEAAKLGLPDRIHVVLVWNSGHVAAPLTCGPASDPLNVAIAMDLALMTFMADNGLDYDAAGNIVADDALPAVEELHVHDAPERQQ